MSPAEIWCLGMGKKFRSDARGQWERGWLQGSVCGALDGWRFLAESRCEAWRFLEETPFGLG